MVLDSSLSEAVQNGPVETSLQGGLTEREIKRSVLITGCGEDRQADVRPKREILTTRLSSEQSNADSFPV